MVIVVVSVGVAELRNGAEPLLLLLQQQRHPPHDDVGGRYIGGDALTANSSFDDIIMVVMMVVGALVGREAVGLGRKSSFSMRRCHGGTT